jgi:sulfonate transport system ATP-binding protein
VAENIGFEAGKAGANHPRVNELMEEVDLQGKNDFYPKQLSGGMAQRVAIARGLFSQPSVLLLDEPFSAVDAFTRMRLQDLLRNVAERHHTTLLFVTHDIDEAVYLSDHVCVMQANPGTIKTKVSIGLPRLRDRRDPRLAQLKSQILTLLDEGSCEHPNEIAGEVQDHSLELNLLQFAV